MNSSFAEGAEPESRMSFRFGNFQWITASAGLTVVTGAVGTPAGTTGWGLWSGVKPLFVSGKAASMDSVFGLALHSRIFKTTGFTQRNKSSTEMSKIMMTVITNHADKATMDPNMPRLLNRMISRKLPI